LEENTPVYGQHSQDERHQERGSDGPFRKCSISDFAELGVPKAHGGVVRLMIWVDSRVSVFGLVRSYLDFFCWAVGRDLAFVVEGTLEALGDFHGCKGRWRYGMNQNKTTTVKTRSSERRMAFMLLVRFQMALFLRIVEHDVVVRSNQSVMSLFKEPRNGRILPRASASLEH
jgi:hypothetical protein